MKFKIFYSLFISLLVISLCKCDSVETKITEPDFVIDKKIFSANLEAINNNVFKIRISYLIAFHFVGQPGYITKLTFLTEGFTSSLSMRQSAPYEVGREYQQDLGFWLPDSLNNFDTLRIIFNVNGSFEIQLKDSITYTNFVSSDSVDVNVQK